MFQLASDELDGKTADDHLFETLFEAHLSKIQSVRKKNATVQDCMLELHPELVQMRDEEEYNQAMSEVCEKLAIQPEGMREKKPPAEAAADR